MLEIHFDDSAFDLVICQYGVMFVPDKDLSATQIKKFGDKPMKTFLNAIVVEAIKQNFINFFLKIKKHYAVK